jgi:uncharacterized protein YdhG (YjbR/CyaY superfamily)
MGRAKSVGEYITSAQKDHQPALRRMRAIIRRHLPRATESIGSSGFPVYTMNGKWLTGFATRKKGPMLYVMDRALVDRFSPYLGKLRSAHSCVDWRASGELSLDELEKIANRMLAELSRGMAKR